MKNLVISSAVALVLGFGVGWVAHQPTDSTALDVNRAVSSGGLTVDKVTNQSVCTVPFSLEYCASKGLFVEPSAGYYFQQELQGSSPNLQPTHNPQ